MKKKSIKDKASEDKPFRHPSRLEIIAAAISLIDAYESERATAFKYQDLNRMVWTSGAIGALRSIVNHCDGACAFYTGDLAKEKRQPS